MVIEFNASFMHSLNEGKKCTLVKYTTDTIISYIFITGVVAEWCNPPTLQPEKSGGVSSIPCRAPPLERHNKGWRTRLGHSHKIRIVGKRTEGY